MAVGDVVQGLTGRAGLRGAARGHVRVVGQALASGSASSWLPWSVTTSPKGDVVCPWRVAFLGVLAPKGLGEPAI